ncbi:hypothetical protein AKO1_015227 [Acrasis kona]|uniref:Uncharacterized protein n=1 Tax=Acrasis kona TaxID=1008807 RepID=A0AAW2ZFU4_9EUKA
MRRSSKMPCRRIKIWLTNSKPLQRTTGNNKHRMTLKSLQRRSDKDNDDEGSDSDSDSDDDKDNTEEKEEGKDNDNANNKDDQDDDSSDEDYKPSSLSQSSLSPTFSTPPITALQPSQPSTHNLLNPSISPSHSQPASTLPLSTTLDVPPSSTSSIHLSVSLNNKTSPQLSSGFDDDASPHSLGEFDDEKASHSSGDQLKKNEQDSQSPIVASDEDADHKSLKRKRNSSLSSSTIIMDDEPPRYSTCSRTQHNNKRFRTYNKEENSMEISLAVDQNENDCIKKKLYYDYNSEE